MARGDVAVVVAGVHVADEAGACHVHISGNAAHILAIETLDVGVVDAAAHEDFLSVAHDAAGVSRGARGLHVNLAVVGAVADVGVAVGTADDAARVARRGAGVTHAAAVDAVLNAGGVGGITGDAAQLSAACQVNVVEAVEHLAAGLAHDAAPLGRRAGYLAVVLTVGDGGAFGAHAHDAAGVALTAQQMTVVDAVLYHAIAEYLIYHTGGVAALGSGAAVHGVVVDTVAYGAFALVDEACRATRRGSGERASLQGEVAERAALLEGAEQSHV